MLTGVSPATPANDKNLRILVWMAMSGLIGLACAIPSAIFSRYAIQEDQSQTFLFLTILTILTLNASAIAAIFSLSQKDVSSRLLLSFAFSFLAHFLWFSFSAGRGGELTWGVLPLTYLAALACSLAVSSLCKPFLAKRIGVVAPGLPLEILRRLGNDVESIVDPEVEPSRYDVLLVDFAFALPPEWARFVSSAALCGCDVRHVRNYAIQHTARLLLDDVEPDALRRNLTRSGPYILLKRWIDIIATIFMAPIALVLVGAAAVAILISMGHPIVYVQDRVGRNGRIFRMYKLRTMCAQSLGGKQIATLKSDCRITPLGKILRRYRIDELPQLINILKGDMSLIGPRPEQPQLVEEYRQVLPHYDLRHEVQPGLSGWAQVTFGYAATIEETQEKLTYDLFYIREFGFALDVEIAIATLWTLITGRNVR
jgi:lipopolysaccharide/colanic/teichoic acid biosynthesis glycosyltransferase